MPAPIYFAHKVLKVLSEKRRSRPALRSAARREEPGHRPLRERRADRLHQGRRLDAAQRGEPQRQEVHARHGARADRGLSRVVAAGRLDAEEVRRLPRQPDRQFRRRRPGRRLRAHRAKNHRRYLWRLCPAWRRRLFRQGPDQGRPLRRLCGALSRQERRRRRSSPTAAPSRSPMRSASPIRCRSWSTRTARARSRSASSKRRCRSIFRLTPTNIRRTLKLNRPIYRRTASYGHFGRAPEKDGGFSWERTDLAKEIKSAVS